MRVTFESTVFDPVGSIGLDALPGSDLSASTRRVTGTATLDGNAVIIDNGYTAADSTLLVEAWGNEPDLRMMMGDHDSRCAKDYRDWDVSIDRSLLQCNGIDDIRLYARNS